MKQSKRKIVSDSSCDLKELFGAPLDTAELKIITAQKEYTDSPSLDVQQMVEELQSYKGRSSTSCPNVEDWLEVFGDAQEVFCVTITGTLSGSYHSACLAADNYREQHPERKVFILDSLSTGPEIGLILEELSRLISEDKSFDDICREITDYSKKTGLLFMLQSMKNLANNGRVSPLVAGMAGLLGIRVVGKASNRGDLEQLNKCRGEKKALETMVQQLCALDYAGGKIRIHHCINEGAAQKLQKLILERFPKAQTILSPCRGLCSFYAEKGGLLIGFEKG